MVNLFIVHSTERQLYKTNSYFNAINMSLAYSTKANGYISMSLNLGNGFVIPIRKYFGGKLQQQYISYLALKHDHII